MLLLKEAHKIKYTCGADHTYCLLFSAPQLGTTNIRHIFYFFFFFEKKKDLYYNVLQS